MDRYRERERERERERDVREAEVAEDRIKDSHLFVPEPRNLDPLPT